ncbi:MAG: hypothetical protein JW969_21400 [Spirochaetales bacterium]|nr:hypothetical protein [Spirochaetales bacterium]
MTDLKIYYLIKNFLNDNPGKFQLDQFVNWADVNGSPFRYEEDVDRAVLFFLKEGYLTKDFVSFVSQAECFRGMEIGAALTPFERDNGFLIPGHRFLPFHEMPSKPWTMVLLGPDGKEIPKKKAILSLETLPLYLRFFGPDSLFAYLYSDSDNPDDEIELKDGSADVETTVFDLSSFLKDTAFSGEDTLILSAVEPEKKVFEIRKKASSDQPDKKVINAFVRKLDKAFEQVFKLFGPVLTMPQQIAHALYFTGPAIYLKPALHLGGYINLSRQVLFLPLEQSEILWSQKVAGPFDKNFECGLLDKYLSLLDISLSESEIEAFMRDELFTRNNSFENVKDRCFRGRALRIENKEFKDEFYAMLKELWEETQKHYNYFSDQNRGRLRSQLLRLLDEQINFIRSLDARKINTDSLPEDFYELGHIGTLIAQSLKALNNEEVVTARNERIMSDSIVQLSGIMSSLINNIELSLTPASQRGKLKIVKPEKKDN